MSAQQNKNRSLLVTIETVGERYGMFLASGLFIIGILILVGYFTSDTLYEYAIIAALIFVFGPPAVLMMSFIVTSIYYKLKK